MHTKTTYSCFQVRSQPTWAATWAVLPYNPAPTVSAYMPVLLRNILRDSRRPWIHDTFGSKTTLRPCIVQPSRRAIGPAAGERCLERPGRASEPAPCLSTSV
jgi:hypothetical protein